MCHSSTELSVASNFFFFFFSFSFNLLQSLLLFFHYFEDSSNTAYSARQEMGPTDESYLTTSGGITTEWAGSVGWIMKMAKDQPRRTELALRFLGQVGEPIEHKKKQKTEKPKTKTPRVSLPMIWPGSVSLWR